MPKTISISLPHDLGTEEAKRRVQDQLERLRKEYVDKVGQSQVNWAGDQAKVDVSALGQAASATIDVLPDTLRIEVELPWVLAALSTRVQSFMTSHASDALRLTHTK
ncbi:polyhydroxyalkanoic acid system family protein [Methyloferula stellata]|uniref:polyhydroxyalkanoic acid system family protein n=1 Tax=Methyloferula stellata TaxID=876270 RepID=UPI000373C274|nr:polyhydroxyalkanoic acid system family protein [Methyloferula stellata]